MEPYIKKSDIVSEIDKKLQDLIAYLENVSFTEQRIVLWAKIDMCKEILSSLDTLEMEEVDLENELKNLIGNVGQCDRKLARHFFELGLKVKAEINKPVNDQGTTPLIIHVPPKFGQGTLSRPAYKNGCFYHQNFISDKEFLDRAIDFIVDKEEENDYICEQLHNIPEEFKLCAKDCQNLDHWCILRFLKHYKIKHLYESKP